jgi:hypothetical protein
MFTKAVAAAAQFTRPIHIITRCYGSTEVYPGAATLFFVNSDGWALTCRHVAEFIAAAGLIAKRRAAFRAAISSAPATANPKKYRAKMEAAHGFSAGATFGICTRFMNCIEGSLNVKIIGHPNPKIDAALLHFTEYDKLHCTTFPVFASGGAALAQGKMLCRLGFPFPEFTNFRYNAETDDISWTDEGRLNTPQFPIDGMVTRHLVNDAGQVVGFEMSTPGLRGQSGGPAFDADGLVWGMQSATAHLDLDFDVNQEVLRSGKRRRVTDSAFLHVGHCVHVDTLRRFMQDTGVSFKSA